MGVVVVIIVIVLIVEIVVIKLIAVITKTVEMSLIIMPNDKSSYRYLKPHCDAKLIVRSLRYKETERRNEAQKRNEGDEKPEWSSDMQGERAKMAKGERE